MVAFSNTNEPSICFYFHEWTDPKTYFSPDAFDIGDFNFFEMILGEIIKVGQTGSGKCMDNIFEEITSQHRIKLIEING